MGGSKKWRVSCGNCPAGFKNRGKMDCRQDMMAGVKCIDSACRERGKPLAGLGDDDPDCCAHPKDAYCDPGFTLSFITEAEWAKIPLGHRPAAFGYCMDHGHIGNTCCTFDGGPVHSVADPCKTNNGGKSCTKSAAKGKCGYVFQGRGVAGPERDILWMGIPPNPTLDNCLSLILKRGKPCGRDYFTYIARELSWKFWSHPKSTRNLVVGAASNKRRTSVGP